MLVCQDAVSCQSELRFKALVSLWISKASVIKQVQKTDVLWTTKAEQYNNTIKHFFTLLFLSADLTSRGSLDSQTNWGMIWVLEIWPLFKPQTAFLINCSLLWHVNVALGTNSLPQRTTLVSLNNYSFHSI